MTGKDARLQQDTRSLHDKELIPRHELVIHVIQFPGSWWSSRAGNRPHVHVVPNGGLKFVVNGSPDEAATQVLAQIDRESEATGVGDGFQAVEFFALHDVHDVGSRESRQWHAVQLQQDVPRVQEIGHLSVVRASDYRPLLDRDICTLVHHLRPVQQLWQLVLRLSLRLDVLVVGR